MFEKLILNPLGYYEVKDKPSITELNEYYSKKYYQDAKDLILREYHQRILLVECHIYVRKKI